AEPERIRDFLPLAKKYGAAILCLPLTLEGIPETPEKRLEAAQFIRNAALEAGLTDSDLALDPLVLPVAADGQSARVTLDTLKLFKKELGFPTLMGLSNSSFGLPSRPKLNATFLALALEAGLNAPLANPCDEDLKTAWDAAQVLGGFDPQGLSWSQDYHLTASVSSNPVESTTDPLSLIRQSIRQGEKEGILSKLESALANQIPPLELAEQGLTTAMTEVGVDFGAGKCFLPQVLMAAETMRIGFDFLKAKLPKEQTAKGKALVATVQGDIHDLGKNIVVALLENSGFEIIDLGKDVSPEEITSQAKKHNPDFIGLCALMTTTLPALEKTITQLTLGGYNQPIMVGGAVLTEEYSEKIGTTYAKDAISALELANMWTIKKEIANELFTS
ncbi:MAG: cobalamin-dependent protein, partial [Negativicutes bacterium]|nr:cobalamin-dependent protein [Negativicutes bacterium]